MGSYHPADHHVAGYVDISGCKTVRYAADLVHCFGYIEIPPDVFVVEQMETKEMMEPD